MRAQKLLLQVMGHKRLLESHDDVMLLQKIQLRAPYVTPLNVLQVTLCLHRVDPSFSCCLRNAAAIDGPFEPAKLGILKLGSTDSSIEY